MLENYLSNEIAQALDNIPYSHLCELRLRANNPAIVNIMGENYYLTSSEYSKSCMGAIVVSQGVINGIVQKISNNSFYTINDKLIDGYMTINGGIRVGVCGEVVRIDNQVKTIRNISSLNFRFPHFIKNCSSNIIHYIWDKSVHNTLIISPPGAGKTTYLRDLVYQLSSKDNLLNILVVDEREEISKVFIGNEVVRLGNIDIYCNSTKNFAFSNGIRSMKPDIIITDEINLDRDIDVIENALTSGVKIIATIHASNIFDLKCKPAFKDILNKKLFTRFVLLSNNAGVGTLEGVFDEDLRFIGV